MTLGIKPYQFGQLVSLISWSTCDYDCKDCPWKNNGNYNFAEFDCLLKELQSVLPNEKQEKDDDKETERVLSYLKRKEG